MSTDPEIRTPMGCRLKNKTAGDCNQANAQKNKGWAGEVPVPGIEATSYFPR